MKSFSEAFSIILIPIILSQGCIVYHKEPVTLDQAIGNDKGRVKIIANNEKVILLDSLYYKDEVLYGLLYNSKKDILSEVIINPESVAYVYLKDKSKSRKDTIAACIIIPFGLFLVIGAIVAIKDYSVGF